MALPLQGCGVALPLAFFGAGVSGAAIGEAFEDEIDQPLCCVFR